MLVSECVSAAPCRVVNNTLQPVMVTERNPGHVSKLPFQSPPQTGSGCFILELTVNVCMERALPIFVFGLKTLWFWTVTQRSVENRATAGPHRVIVVINLSLEELSLRETSRKITVPATVSVKMTHKFN